MSDEPPIICKRSVTGLLPVNSAAREAVEAYPLGSIVRVRMSKPRSGPHSRKFWALMSAIADAAGEAWTAKKVANLVKIQTGHVEIARAMSGSIFEWPASIAYDKMGQAEFNKFYERALVIVTRDILPKVEPGDLRSQIEDLIAA